MEDYKGHKELRKGCHDNCQSEPVETGAGLAEAGVEQPNDAQHKPSIASNGHSLAGSPGWGLCEMLHTLLNPTVSALDLTDLEEEHQSHRDLKKLQNAMHQQPASQGTIAKPARKPVHCEEDGARDGGEKA
mmetsp:Transcript_44571/g.80117  ORF Transcript_44571/g.80117 Transcript_44571/m.80117 type:complete len:131 (+) Transcript_44571:424-816(+)